MVEGYLVRSGSGYLSGRGGGPGRGRCRRRKRRLLDREVFSLAAWIRLVTALPAKNPNEIHAVIIFHPLMYAPTLELAFCHGLSRSD